MQALDGRMPPIEEGDLAIINQKLDWWGLNYYTPMRVLDDPTPELSFRRPSPRLSSIRKQPILAGRSSLPHWAS